MNQFVKDHAEHCDSYVGNVHYDKTYEEQQRLWVEKFAELVAEDCIAIVERHGSLFAPVYIIDRFGVIE